MINIHGSFLWRMEASRRWSATSSRAPHPAQYSKCHRHEQTPSNYQTHRCLTTADIANITMGSLHYLWATGSAYRPDQIRHCSSVSLSFICGVDETEFIKRKPHLTLNNSTINPLLIENILVWGLIENK